MSHRERGSPACDSATQGAWDMKTLNAESTEKRGEIQVRVNLASKRHEKAQRIRFNEHGRWRGKKPVLLCVPLRIFAVSALKCKAPPCSEAQDQHHQRTESEHD